MACSRLGMTLVKPRPVLGACSDEPTSAGAAVPGSVPKAEAAPKLPEACRLTHGGCKAQQGAKEAPSHSQWLAHSALHSAPCEAVGCCWRTHPARPTGA